MVGDALDIGAGADGLGRQIGIWPLLRTVAEWDKGEGDAQELRGVANNSYDLVHSSHCLEHIADVRVALGNWWRIVRPGGHLVVVVPDAEFYERGNWPSRFNPDHKHRFTMAGVWSHLVAAINEPADVLKVERLIAHFDPSLPKDVDQSRGLCEPAIEFIVRKPE